MRFLLAGLASLGGAQALYSSGSPVQLLGSADFEKKVIGSKEPWLIEFYASWCGHCKQLAPEYEKAAKALKGIVNVGAVEDQAVMGKYGVQGFPTLKFFGENKKSPMDYNGARDSKGLATFAKPCRAPFATRSRASRRMRARVGRRGFRRRRATRT